jgi:uncharacterized protein (TIGR02598 family)
MRIFVEIRMTPMATKYSSRQAMPSRLRPSNLSISTFYSSCSAFSLVEIVVAIGIAAFCLVAMLGLIPTGMKSVKSATEQTAAVAVLQEVVTDLRSTPSGSNTTSKLGIDLPLAGVLGSSRGGNSTFYMSESGVRYSNNTSLDARYGVSLAMTNRSTFITSAQVTVWWPSTVSAANAQGAVETITTILRQ